MTSSSFRSVTGSDDYQEESGLLDAPSIEDNLMEAFDNLVAKSSKTRFVAYETIRRALSQQYLADFIYNKKITILDTICRSIKRNRGQDLGHAATLISLVCVTIGQGSETDPVFSELNSQLLVLLSDETVSTDVRTKCARAIGICTYVVGITGYIEQVIDRLYAIFCSSCAKGDGNMPNPSEQLATLHATCLQAWTLLLTALSSSAPNIALELVEERMDKITELLDSPHLDVRISAGETLAVMCEFIKTQNEDVTGDDFDDLCDKIRELMTETQKSRGKKDLRQQRSNFREILATIEENEPPSETVKFGRERLALDSWSRKLQYDAFCEVFGNGINHHLAENEIVREIFDLGQVTTHMDLPKVKRTETSDKSRTKNLRRLRDKRADVIDR